VKRVPDQIYVGNLTAGPVIRVEVPEFATKRSGHGNVEARRACQRPSCARAADPPQVHIRGPGTSKPDKRVILSRELLLDYGSDDAPISGWWLLMAAKVASISASWAAFVSIISWPPLMPITCQFLLRVQLSMNF
jgi:hypothetical protein